MKIDLQKVTTDSKNVKLFMSDGVIISIPLKKAPKELKKIPVLKRKNGMVTGEEYGKMNLFHFKDANEIFIVNKDLEIIAD